MEIITTIVGSLMVNCYYVYERGAPEGIVIDPGHSAKNIANQLKKAGVDDVLILLTHGHFDHSNAAAELAGITEGKIFMNRADEFLLDASGDEMAEMMGYFGTKPKIAGDLKDGQVVKHGKITLKVIHTPGHSPGSVCFYNDEGNIPVLFSGDTLFNLSIGRTDLPGGDYRLILNNIVEKIWPLPGMTRILTGHGPETNLDFERRHNPFLNDV